MTKEEEKELRNRLAFYESEVCRLLELLIHCMKQMP